MLLWTDTDSLACEIETNNVYKDFYINKDMFDFSEYPDNSKFFEVTDIGKMKLILMPFQLLSLVY